MASAGLKARGGRWASPGWTWERTSSRRSRWLWLGCACTCSGGAKAAPPPPLPLARPRRPLPPLPRLHFTSSCGRSPGLRLSLGRRVAAFGILLGLFFAAQRGAGPPLGPGGAGARQGGRRAQRTGGEAGLGVPGADIVAQYFSQPPVGRRGQGSSAAGGGGPGGAAPESHPGGRGGGAGGSFSGTGHRLGGS